MVTVTVDDARSIAAGVPDPELPFVTIEELGILRGVEIGAAGQVVVTITPTYSGCPALEAIRDDVLARLDDHGYRDVEVRTAMSPAWTTDWITSSGRESLRRHGIAPPGPRSRQGGTAIALKLSVRCPRCGSLDTREIAHFGSTACKAIYTCTSCREPFDHVKPL